VQVHLFHSQAQAWRLHTGTHSSGSTTDGRLLVCSSCLTARLNPDRAPHLVPGDAEVDGGDADAVQRRQLPQRQQGAVQLRRVRHRVAHLLQRPAAQGCAWRLNGIARATCSRHRDGRSKRRYSASMRTSDIRQCPWARALMRGSFAASSKQWLTPIALAYVPSSLAAGRSSFSCQLLSDCGGLHARVRSGKLQMRLTRRGRRRAG